MVTSIVQFFYPDLTDEQVKKFGLLSITFFCIIGSYWMLRLLKDVIFFKIAFPASLGWAVNQGSLFQPSAKIYSVAIVFFVVLIYSKLVDLFEKHKLFYIICSFYATVFLGITALLAVNSIYGSAFLGKNLLALLGWGSYFSIESFGSILVALFWSFTVSVTATNAAKKGFPFIVAGAQIGSILGSALPFFAKNIGIWQLFLIATILVVCVMFLIHTFITVIPEKDRIGDKKAAATAKKKEGFFEGFFAGIKLLLTRKYLFGVLILSTFYEVVGTIVDYQMKAQASMLPAYSSIEGFARFMSTFGVCVNSLSFFMALLGTAYMMKQFGLRFCLLIYPTVLGIAVIALYVFFRTGPSPSQLLFATFGVMILAKGLSYAVNNPTKEMMYIPTSKDAKFKAKGWVDMFGGRTAKMGGAQVTNAFRHNLSSLMMYGTFISLGLIGVWIAVAVYVGTKNKELVDSGEIVE